MSNIWVQQKERSNPFTLRLICWIALHIGRPVARFWLYPITAYYYLTAKSARQASRRYWHRLLQHQPSELRIIKHIYWFSATVLDRVFFLTDQFDKFNTRIENQQLLNVLQAEGKGALLVGAHIGSFEVLRSLALGHYQVPLKILMYRNHNQMISRVLDSLNPEVSHSVIDLADPNAMFQVRESVERGEFVGMLGDRVVDGGRIMQCCFLGDEAQFPTGPLQLATVLQVPVILVFGVYEGRNKYTIHFEKLTDAISLIPRQARHVLVNDLTTRYVEHLESIVRRYPYNWFNFYDFWQDESTG